MATSSSSKQGVKDEILMLLTDAEIGKVSMAETKTSLPASEQYIDLDHLDAGIQTSSDKGMSALANIIPRSAVAPKTWDKIVTRLRPS